VIVAAFDNRPMGGLRWDLFCRVIDNHGDVGVCWRLAAQLGARGDHVRLIVDDASALAWMAPRGAAGVEVRSWTALPPPGDVVIEAFGCDPPPEFVDAMARSTPAPVWLNLEYLSAEDYVERSHALPSPQRNGLTKWFYFPGFTSRSGGLLREDGLLQARAGFERDAWLAALGAARRPGERVVSLFCYPNPRLAGLLRDLAAAPTLLLATPGAAQQQLQALPEIPAGVRVHVLPWFDQPGYDRLLWSSDLNFVRGEDSLVRSIWAGAPFVWQAYPQHDTAHLGKLEALLARLAPPPAAAELLRAWNGFAPWPGLPTPAAWADWQAAVLRWRRQLAVLPDLATALRQFALAKGAPLAGAPPGQPQPGC
jgi:uncharacterized repeat protein (TIGR03837 family)